MKKFRRMSGIFILCIGLLLSSIPVGASDRENDLDKLETNLISQIAEEYGFAEEKTSSIPFPSGYLIRVDNNMPHGAAIWFTVNYKDSKGNYKEIQEQIGLQV